MDRTIKTSEQKPNYVLRYIFECFLIQIPIEWPNVKLDAIFRLAFALQNFSFWCCKIYSAISSTCTSLISTYFCFHTSSNLDFCNWFAVFCHKPFLAVQWTSENCISLVFGSWESTLMSNGLVFRHHLKSKLKSPEIRMVGPFENWSNLQMVKLVQTILL
jgi:hypothetical protein